MLVFNVTISDPDHIIEADEDRVHEQIVESKELITKWDLNTHNREPDTSSFTELSLLLRQHLKAPHYWHFSLR